MQSKVKETNDYKFIMFAPKRKAIVSFVLAAVIYLIMTFIFKNNYEVLDTIIRICYVVSSFTVLLLIKAIYTEHNGGYFKYIAIIFILIALENTRGMLPVAENSFMSIFNYKVIFNDSILNLAICLLYFNAYKFNFKLKNNIIGPIITSVICCEIFFGLSIDQLVVIVNSLTILHSLLLLIQSREIKFSIGKDINYIKVGLIRLSILATIGIIYIFNQSNIHAKVILNIYTMLFFSGVMANVSIIIQKILKSPYKLLFNELYDRNQNLNTLNKSIVNKNRELEISQMIIRNKEKTFKTFFENIPIPLIILCKNNNRIMFTNRGFKELVNKNIREIINKKLDNLVSMEDKIYSMKRNEQISNIYRCTIETGGEKKYVDMEIVDVNESDNQIIAIFIDVTSKVKLDKIKEEMQNKLFEEKIKRDFLSNISHDLKTPINVIYSATQLIKFYVQDSNLVAIEKYNTISTQNCVALTRFTDDLIDNSKIYSSNISAKLVEKNIVEVIEDIVMSLVDYAKTKDVKLIFDTNSEEIYIEIDTQLMQRVMLNLISNSLKFCKEKGLIEVVIQDEKKFVKIIVKDNGVGMDKTFREKAFSRYSMGNNNKYSQEKGTGIGLCVVKKMVEEQRGTINLESSLEQGTSIEIVFKKEK